MKKLIFSLCIVVCCIKGFSQQIINGDELKSLYENGSWNEVIKKVTDFHKKEEWLSHRAYYYLSKSYERKFEFSTNDEERRRFKFISDSIFMTGEQQFGQSLMNEGYDMEVYTITENQPEKPENYDLYIATNFKYPQSALERGIEGNVFLQFHVTIDGSLEGIKVIKGIDPECDIAAMELLRNCPKWRPASHRGHLVYAKTVEPISFSNSSYEAYKKLQKKIAKNTKKKRN